MSGIKSTVKSKPVGARRFEVITDPDSRRRWSVDEKARIVGETLEAGVSVSDVARRHGLRPQQIFTWRREARSGSSEAGSASFAPVVLAEPLALPSPKRNPSTAAGPTPVPIEVKIGKAVVRVREGADPKALVAVVRALTRGR